ncbi:hypothetical protein [Brachybacterium phenoliresistens]|uniref:hypothetical protein n=1 Tax=Brachybacterium phenoliresistens TaxID=396014 RepID=UPI0031D9CF6C
MTTTPLPDVTTHHDVPFTKVPEFTDFSPSPDEGVSKYTAQIPRDVALEALLLNKHSDVLLVALHGATMRHKELPRFEFFRTLRATPYSSLYFSDPALYLDPEIQLAWYTGWPEFDLHPVIADWAGRAAAAIGASRVIFFGSSGGGLAALQASTFLPASMAVPFSAQTSVANYLVAGTGLGAQRSYIRAIMPHLTPADGLGALRPDVDYFTSVGDRLSPLLRYQQKQENYVLFVQNANDHAHFNQHYLPFRAAVEDGPNADRIKFEIQEDRPGHNPPRQEFLKDALGKAIAWSRTLT